MEPVRTCVGCRARAARSSLLRVVAQNPVVVVDETAVLPGRGAWLHPRIECLDRAQQRRAFGRAFRVKTALDTSSVRDFLERQVIHPSIRTHSVSTEQAETYIVTN